MFFSPTDFHRFAQIWLHVIRAHLWHQWEMFFSPTDFTDFHRFGYMLSVFICVISGECSFLPRIFTDFTDLVTCYPCSFVASVGNIFPPTDFTDFHRFGYMLSVFICGISGKCSFFPRISQIFTDLVTCYPCSFVLSVGNVLFSHGFH